MNLWPIAFVIVSALAIFQLDATFPDALRRDGASERLIYLGLLLAIILIYGYRFRRVRAAPLLKMGLAWVAILITLVAGYTYRDGVAAVWADIRGQFSPTIAITRQEGEVELRKAWDGHFRAVTKVNGQNVGMLIDTGASIVLLSYEDAVAAGLEPQNLTFTMPVTTANGRSHVAPVTLETVSVGAVGLSNVKAAVAAQGKVRSSLLGMSFLGRLQETSFRRDRLILKN